MSKNFKSKFGNRGPRTMGLGLRGHMTLGQGVSIDFQDRFRLHDELVADRGEILIHETGISCPKCRHGDRDDPVLFSDNCDCENGWLYRNPRKIQALVTGINIQRDLDVVGFSVPGDCMISPRPNLRPQVSEFDKITFTWPQVTGDGEVIVRGAEYKRIKERGGTNLIASNEDVLMYMGGNAIHVEDVDGVLYCQDADFVFDGRIIRWVADGNSPTIRKRYTIKYEGYFEWIAIIPPVERRDRGRNLGPRVLLRKKHVFNSELDPNRDTPDELSEGTDGVFGGKVTA